MKTRRLLIPICIFCWSCTDDAAAPQVGMELTLPAAMNYEYDCLGGAAGNTAVGMMEQGGKWLREATIGDTEVTDAEQNSWGDELLSAIKSKGEPRILTKDPQAIKLRFILKDLLRKRINPSGINYSIYLLDDDATINAFTFGGKIFVTKAIINQCTDDDQLYAILGHEIGHNEKGHIKASIQELKASRELLGEWGDKLVGLKNIATAVFNQRAEVEADYYGIDLVYMLGRKPCAITAFWDGMSKKEGDYNQLEDYLRSHPYSAPRAACLRKHVVQNFKITCP